MLKNPLYLLIIAFGFVFIIQMYYYMYYYLRIVFYKKDRFASSVKEPVSVVICARNEQENLEKNLPSILNQDYPDYEVIVVNDCSEDETEFVIGKLQKKYKHLRTTTIKPDEKFYHSKKLALTIGIKAAKNDIVLLTDADCIAVNEKWIEHMQRSFVKGTDIVLGYGGYIRRKSFINNLIRFDTFFIGIQYLTFALAKKPYMGVGRNLAYRKTLFFKNKGFASHNHIQSGDDDLFINQVANKKNTRVAISHSASTLSEAESSFINWFKQKKRHLSTGSFYKFKTKWLLFWENFSRVLFYILFVLSLIWFKEYYLYILGAFAFRMIVQGIIFKVAINRLNEKYLLLSSFFYDIIMPFLSFLFFLTNYFSSKGNKWK